MKNLILFLSLMFCSTVFAQKTPLKKRIEKGPDEGYIYTPGKGDRLKYRVDYPLENTTAYLTIVIKDFPAAPSEITAKEYPISFDFYWDNDKKNSGNIKIHQKAYLEGDVCNTRYVVSDISMDYPHYALFMSAVNYYAFYTEQKLSKIKFEDEKNGAYKTIEMTGRFAPFRHDIKIKGKNYPLYARTFSNNAIISDNSDPENYSTTVHAAFPRLILEQYVPNIRFELISID
jgi:hypothetical protein